MKLNEIYSDGYGKIKSGKDELTGSIVLRVEYLDLAPENITFPNEAIDKIIDFLQLSRNADGIDA
jgi:hypothetical protein